MLKKNKVEPANVLEIPYDNPLELFLILVVCQDQFCCTVHAMPDC